MVGKIIKYMRKYNNISQEKLSIMTYIGRTTISDYEREKTDINFENLEKIAKLCNFEILIKNKKTNEILKPSDIERKID